MEVLSTMTMLGQSPGASNGAAAGAFGEITQPAAAGGLSFMELLGHCSGTPGRMKTDAQGLTAVFAGIETDPHRQILQQMNGMGGDSPCQPPTFNSMCSEGIESTIPLVVTSADQKETEENSADGREDYSPMQTADYQQSVIINPALNLLPEGRGVNLDSGCLAGTPEHGETPIEGTKGVNPGEMEAITAFGKFFGKGEQALSMEKASYVKTPINSPEPARQAGVPVGDVTIGDMTSTRQTVVNWLNFKAPDNGVVTDAKPFNGLTVYPSTESMVPPGAFISRTMEVAAPERRLSMMPLPKGGSAGQEKELFGAAGGETVQGMEVLSPDGTREQKQGEDGLSLPRMERPVQYTVSSSRLATAGENVANAKGAMYPDQAEALKESGSGMDRAENSPADPVPAEHFRDRLRSPVLPAANPFLQSMAAGGKTGKLASEQSQVSDGAELGSGLGEVEAGQLRRRVEISFAGDSGSSTGDPGIGLGKGKRVTEENGVIYHERVAESRQNGETAPKSSLGEGKPESPDRIHGQIKEKLQNGNYEVNKNSITLKLHPEELGELKINLRMDDQRLKVEIVTENGAVREALMQNLDSLKETLSRQNITMDRFDVAAELRQGFQQGSRDGSRMAQENRGANAPYQAAVAVEEKEQPAQYYGWESGNSLVSLIL